MATTNHPHHPHHTPPIPIGPIRRALLAISGTNMGVLAQCPTEVEPRTGLGVAVLIPTVLGTFGGAVTVALAQAGEVTNASMAAAAPFALGIGAVIFVLDRLMVTMASSVSTFVLRAVITLCLALLIGESLQLVLFRSEIAAKLDEIQAAEQTEAVEAADAAAAVELARIEAPALEAPTARADLDAARVDVEAARTALADAQAALTEEVATGRGPIAEERSVAVTQAEAALADAQAVEAAAVSALAAAEAADATATDAEAAAIADVEAARAVAIADAAAGIEAANGPLAQFHALHALAIEDPTGAGLKVALVSLLLLALDSLPLTVKLAYVRRTRRPYCRLMAAYAALEESKADRLEALVSTSAAVAQAPEPPKASTGRKVRGLSGGRLTEGRLNVNRPSRRDLDLAARLAC